MFALLIIASISLMVTVCWSCGETLREVYGGTLWEVYGEMVCGRCMVGRYVGGVW